MFKLIVSIVPHNSGEFITNAAKQAGAAGGTIVMGRGTAQNGLIQLLGLGDTSKDIVYILVPDVQSSLIMESIKSAANTKKAHFGVLFTVDVDSFIKSGSAGTNVQSELLEKKEQGDLKMENKNYELINIIVNKGYAEDAMDAARKAGAGGGTIIGARGTAKEGDAKFFGIEIVPEKEMLMILVPAEKKADIVKAVSSLPCFAKAGSGIVFCNAANDFTLLGKNA